MLDHVYHETIPRPKHDDNIYTYGRVNLKTGDGFHNIAIAQLPLAETGKASAATVAKDMRRTSPNLKFGLMVGIAGGVWTCKTDIRLGDIVVGIAEDNGPGVIQYDHGKYMKTSCADDLDDLLHTLQFITDLSLQEMRLSKMLYWHDTSMQHTVYCALRWRPLG